jgi:WD40 repeat protein
MEFTEGFKTVGARLSPSGRYVAGLYRRDTAQLFVAVHFTTNGALHYLLTVPESSPGRRELVWAPNNQFLLLVDYVLAKLFVWDFEASGQPICSITENVRLGVERIMWAPDSHHVLVVLKHRVAARIWKLDEKFPRAVIHSPKFTDRGFTFSPDGRWLAVLVRREFEDVIIVYDSAWRVVQSVRPPESANLEDLVFCPFLERTTELRSAIIAWEAPAFSDRIFIFAPDGASCKVISGLAEYSSGYEKVVWSKAGWIAAAVRDPTSFSLWNSITQKMGAILDIGPSSLMPHEAAIMKWWLIL